MRLTKSEKVFKEKGLEIDKIYASKQYIKEIYKKLSQLEDIEDELGIDLITLFKALKDGFYVKYEDEKCFADFESPAGKFSLRYGELFYGHKWLYQYIKLKDYSKTWALDKKELE